MANIFRNTYHWSQVGMRQNVAIVRHNECVTVYAQLQVHTQICVFNSRSTYRCAICPFWYTHHKRHHQLLNFRYRNIGSRHSQQVGNCCLLLRKKITSYITKYARSQLGLACLSTISTILRFQNYSKTRCKYCMKVYI